MNKTHLLMNILQGKVENKTCAYVKIKKFNFFRFLEQKKRKSSTLPFSLAIVWFSE